jgi:hypothetical protein
MVNDPAALYYFTGLGGVVLPNESVEIIPDIAAKYGITHLLIETVDGALAVPRNFEFDVNVPPDFLTFITDLPGARLYAIEP